MSGQLRAAVATGQNAILTCLRVERNMSRWRGIRGGWDPDGILEQMTGVLDEFLNPDHLDSLTTALRNAAERLDQGDEADRLDAHVITQLAEGLGA